MADSKLPQVGDYYKLGEPGDFGHTPYIKVHAICHTYVWLWDERVISGSKRTAVLHNDWPNRVRYFGGVHEATRVPMREWIVRDAFGKKLKAYSVAYPDIMSLAQDLTRGPFKLDRLGLDRKAHAVLNVECVRCTEGRPLPKYALRLESPGVPAWSIEDA